MFFFCFRLNKMSSRERPVLFLCGDEKFGLGEFKKLEKLAIQMNVRVYDRSRKFDDNVTHVIYHSIGNAPQLTKSVMCGLAAGKWVVYHSFLVKSARKKSWTNEKAHLPYPACVELRKTNEISGPFIHMRAVIISNNDLKVEAYTSIIKAGGGIVYDKIKGIRDLSGRKWQRGDLTHVLLDLAFMKPMHRFYDLLADFIQTSKVLGNVRFLYSKYIPEYLREGGHVKEDRFDLLKPGVLSGYLRRVNQDGFIRSSHTCISLSCAFT
ncbi:uncharacterized protein LOC111696601 [Eurytemora carolleeae]|uniref:uncharacterized protein LOC111696601 n=1 Tax=Eurytemora carolleeae TaxID=1294199 RepID=UPI000C7605BC|nr:uncharacterized protein LOC111696601 [Eurytemora carolleeae]|eukprot:XP_023322009.1 uncharacterized protein LOC111696601 [Eurytemora affinis]